MKGPRRQAGILLAASILFLAGCAQPALAPGPMAGASGAWSGRLALQVDGNQTQSFAATFDLRGSADSGELTLSTPLGGTLAALAWTPASATLRANGGVRQFTSVEALVVQATGTAIPVAALFDWLAGTNTPVPGWEADLSQLPQGRIRASRTDPAPQAELRVALDR